MVESIQVCMWEGPTQLLLSIFFSITKHPVTTPAWGHAKSPQKCPTLWYPTDYSLPGSSVHGFSRQRYWSGLTCPPPGDLPDPGIETTSLVSPELAGRFLPTSALGSPVTTPTRCFFTTGLGNGGCINYIVLAWSWSNHNASPSKIYSK